MSDTTEELCHCGQPLHYTDEVVEAFTRDLIKTLGPTVKVNVGTRTWEVERHYIALHGVRAAELPDLGFPEVDTAPPDSPGYQEGLALSPSGAIEAVPGPLEGDESDEALLEHQAGLEASSARMEPSAERRVKQAQLDDIVGGPRFGSPMRSVLDSGAMKLSDALQIARDAKGRATEQAAHYDLLEAIAEFMLGN